MTMKRFMVSSKDGDTGKMGNSWGWAQSYFPVSKPEKPLAKMAPRRDLEKVSQAILSTWRNSTSDRIPQVRNGP